MRGELIMFGYPGTRYHYGVYHVPFVSLWQHRRHCRCEQSVVSIIGIICMASIISTVSMVGVVGIMGVVGFVGLCRR